MKLKRYQDTDSLSFDLSFAAADDAGKIVGTDRPHASERIGLRSSTRLPSRPSHRLTSRTESHLAKPRSR